MALLGAAGRRLLETVVYDFLPRTLGSLARVEAPSEGDELARIEMLAMVVGEALKGAQCFVEQKGEGEEGRDGERERVRAMGQEVGRVIRRVNKQARGLRQGVGHVEEKVEKTGLDVFEEWFGVSGVDRGEHAGNVEMQG